MILKYNIAIACLYGDETRDAMEDVRFSISNSFGITGGAMKIAANFSQETAMRLASQGGTIYRFMFIIPKNVATSKIQKLSEVRKYGGLFVGGEPYGYGNYATSGKLRD